MRYNFKPLSILLIACVLMSCNQTKQFKPKKNIILIETNNSSMNIKVGQKIYYNAIKHSSVGIQPNVSSDNESILKLHNTHTAFKHRNYAKTAGGDKATKTYIFEAINTGDCTITIQNIYRDKIEQEDKIAITIAK